MEGKGFSKEDTNISVKNDMKHLFSKLGLL